MCKEKNKIIFNKKTNHGGNWLKGKFKFTSKKKPLISIITVTLNSQKYLEKTLKSIFSQQYKNYEIIIIDGKSKDRTLSIIKKYENKIDYWVSEKDKGIYDAFNKGMKFARGEYLGFVNSDDILNKKALKILARYNNKFPQIDFIFGCVKKHWGALYGYKPWKIKFSWGFYSSHSCGFFIKNESAKKLGKYNIKYKHHADWDYFYRMIVKYNLKGIGTKKNEVFGIFRRGGFSSKIDFKDSILETIKIRKKNGQNKFLVFFISVYRLLKNIRLVKSFKKTFILIFHESIK
tara:strand:+ start:218 stop:1087 length:870 start_codon:yes stop_codon:yes gene_type:complete